MDYGPLSRSEGYRQVAGPQFHPREFSAIHEKIDRMQETLDRPPAEMPEEVGASLQRVDQRIAAAIKRGTIVLIIQAALTAAAAIGVAATLLAWGAGHIG